MDRLAATGAGNAVGTEAPALRTPGVVEEVARSGTDAQPSAGDLDIVLDPRPRSVAIARHAVGRLLASAPLIPTERVEDVLLLVSEVVTNAVMHARTTVRVTALAAAGRVLVAVTDDDPQHAPCTAERGTMATSGRGLRLVELLASSWGVEVGETSKVVWFEAAYRPGTIDLRAELA